MSETAQTADELYEAEQRYRVQPLEYRVLVHPLKIQDTDPALKRARELGFELAPTTSEREQMAQVRARVVAVGGMAFSDWTDQRKPEEGDLVLIAKYAGFVVPALDEQGNELRMVSDKDIAGILIPLE